MENKIRGLDEVIYELGIADVALDEVEFVGDMGDVLAVAGRKVIQDRHGLSTGDQGVAEVAADKASSTCDEHAHGARLSAGKFDPGTRVAPIFLTE